MIPDDDLYTQLSGSAPLVALVATRIYAMKAPDNDGTLTDYVVFQRISDPSEHQLSGSIVLRNARYQVSCYSKVHRTARSIAAAVVTALHNFHNANVQRISHENDNDLYESETGFYHVPADFLVTY